MEKGLIGRSAERLASAMRPLPTSSYGYPVRKAYPSEQAFFMRNPNVGGYAAEDNSIVLNEGSSLSNRELGMVAQNEAARLYMRNNQIVPEFPLTQEQQESFQGTPYASSPEALKQSIAARIITGDPSAGKTTKEQKDFAKGLVKTMESPKQSRGIIGRVAERLQMALDGFFGEQPPSTPTFPQNAPQNDPNANAQAPVAAPTYRPIEPETITPSIETKGKITSYNWQGDPYTDTNSRNWIGSWGKISKDGMAISPDIEKQFREAGIKPKDRVRVILSDGTELERTWDNRTMQDKQAIRKFGKPLTGRFDLHFPEGKAPHEKDGVSVIGFQKITQAD